MNVSINFKGGEKVLFKKKMKKCSTIFIVCICIITLLVPNKLAFAEVSTVPVITLIGNATQYVATGSIYRDPGVIITDDKDTNLSETITVRAVTTQSAVTYEKGAYMVFNKEGTYELQYNVTDSDKNVAAKVTRTVEVNTMNDEVISDDYDVHGYEIDLKFKLLSTTEIENLLQGAITTPSAVNITRKDDILTANLIKSNEKEFTTSASVTYEWYINNELIQGGIKDTYAISTENKGKSIVVKVGQYNLESKPFYINKDESQGTTPAGVKVTRKNDNLKAELIQEDESKFTTSAAVTYEWYREEKLVQEGIKDNYSISDKDKGNSIIVKVGQYNLKSKPFYIDEDQPQGTTPAGVSVSARIKGTETVGYTLTGELILEDMSKATTGSAVTYEWYRLSNKDSKNNELIGDNKTYNLISLDQDKYIKLVITYDGESYEAITSKIANKPSTSSSKSSKSKSTSSVSDSSNITTNNQTTTNNNQPVVTIADGWNNSSNEWKYVKNGQVVSGWAQIEGSWYLMDSNGTMKTGWQQTNGTWYLLNNNGAMATGWQQVNGTWYLLNSNGAMATGWQQVNGTWYLLNSDGAMATGWQQVNGKWYLLNSDGAFVTEWQ
jgi:glucan-binding YG repeat protein